MFRLDSSLLSLIDLQHRTECPLISFVPLLDLDHVRFECNADDEIPGRVLSMWRRHRSSLAHQKDSQAEIILERIRSFCAELLGDDEAFFSRSAALFIDNTTVTSE